MSAVTRTKSRGDHAWRHIVMIIAIIVAVFPPLYVISAAFNGDQTLSGSGFIPRFFFT